jgi:hypothetical protein
VYVNQGRRTLSEQWYFWTHQPPLAAYPSGGAPHIKYNLAHHALDISVPVVNDVAAYYRSLGIPVAFNVRGEGWHMDTLSEAALFAAARKLVKPARPRYWYMNKRERRLALELEAERRSAKRHGGWSKIDPSHLKRAREIVRWFEAQNKRIHKAAKESGWNKANRRARHKAIHNLIK